MPSWTLKEITEAVNGKLLAGKGDETIRGVSFDTRLLEEGDLFIPLTAERNGHEFIQAAIDKGAAASLWSDELTHAPGDFPLIQVSDTEKAFQDFARYYLKKVGPKIVGVTGSNGKTTTKDMVAAVASARYRTHKTEGNFNNHLGMPHTILRMPADTEVLVLEMGMSESGEINLLSNMAEPDIAIITMIGESHIEFLGSRDAISQAKLEIVDGMKNGTLIYPIDEPLLHDKVTAGYAKDTVGRFLTFGKTEEADKYAVEANSEVRHTVFATNSQPDLECRLPIPGIYNVQNALSAILAGEVLGISQEEAFNQLENFQLTKNRLEWVDGINETTILNDAYNASPSSMKAVLNYFQNIDLPGRRVVVLGDVLELGDQTKEMHESLSEAISPEKIDLLVLYGKEMQALDEKLTPNMSESQRVHFSGDKTELTDFLKANLKAEDTVLVKSSLSTGLLEVVSELSHRENR
ncbi:UDP-N-acetylmuramoyl-tripeptide--D-alanyl-D-alanine ligase [Alkalibacterium psychrotolerans]